MSLIDKLIDKVIDGAKKKKTDVIVKKLAKDNPEYAKTLNRHRATYDEVEGKLQKILKEKGLKP